MDVGNWRSRKLGEDCSYLIHRVSPTTFYISFSNKGGVYKAETRTLAAANIWILRTLVAAIKTPNTFIITKEDR